MRAKTLIVAALVAVLSTASVSGDWRPEDGWKMHFPQLPDLDNGMNVLATQPKILADDFRCTETGLITDIHIWGSWLGDQQSPNGLDVDLYIFKDIPAFLDPADPSIVLEHSRPGELLWAKHFGPTEIKIGNVVTSQEPFFDPNQNEIIGTDTQVIQYNFFINPTQAFFQQDNTIYWLGIQKRFLTPSDNALFGWKSSADHWNDDAVFADLDPDPGLFPGMIPPLPGTSGTTLNWNELIDPRTGESMDLSFVITGEPIPEPASMALLAIGGSSLVWLRRRRRKH